MTVTIVQVVNNTNGDLQYKNTATSYKFTVPAKTSDDETAHRIPSSNYRDDPVPDHSRSDRIEIVSNKAKHYTVKIADKDYNFSVLGPVPPAGKWQELLYGTLLPDGKYILRVDEVSNGNHNVLSLTFLKYSVEDPNLHVNNGHIDSLTIQRADPLAALILLAVFT